MESVLLKLEIKIAGKRGKLGDFLKSLGSNQAKRRHPSTIYATAFVSDENEFIKIYTAANRELIDWIRTHKPESVYIMAKALKKDISNLSKTLRALARFSLVRLEEGHSVRRTLTPYVDWDRLEVLFPPRAKKKAA